MIKFYHSILFFLWSVCLFAQDFTTPFEKINSTSSTYEECIRYYKSLEKKFKQISIKDIGASDVQYPLQLVIIDQDGLTDPEKIKKKDKAIIWINNGIHPGEPEGIDASMILARELVMKPEMRTLLERISIVIIPVYNIGGCLRRNNRSRVNQNGPDYYGFRANSNNLDLNRDFVKQDSRNAKTFVKEYQLWQPDIFIDNHTTDGADYPYQMTLLGSMRDKMTKTMGDYMYEKMLPKLYLQMKSIGDEMIPYVEFEQKMDDGIYAFNDKARFSSGYANMFHAIPFVIETHMLKAFPLRVYSTLNLLKTILQFASKNNLEIVEQRKKAFEEASQQLLYPLHWKIDLNKKSILNLNTYAVEKRYYSYLEDSLFYYNRNKLIPKQIPYYDHYTNSSSIIKPKYYVIPQAYENVIENLNRNGVLYFLLEKDSLIQTKYYKIEDYRTSPNPYENHYLHSQVNTSEVNLAYPYHRGDYIIPTDQNSMQYIIEALEPQAEDSFFAWNYFDGILMRKEYFSDYSFAPIAEKELIDRPELLQSFRKKFASDSSQQVKIENKLDYIYKNSKYAEPYCNIYPVARIFN